MFEPSAGQIPLNALIAVLGAWVAAGIVKTILEWKKGKQFQLFSLGGMPSVHGALVGSLFMAVYFETGISLLLLVVGVLGGIVFRDSWGVRWEVTRHSLALNMLTKSEAYERTGHTKLQAAAGVIFGFLFAVLIYAL